MRGARGGPVPRLGRTAIVLQAAAALAFAGALLRAEDVRLPFTGSGDWHVTAAFADAGGLQSGQRAPVLVAGVPSGRVERVELHDGVAVATLRLDAAARDVLHADARARIEPRSALQDLTVDLEPGSESAPALADGGHIGTARTEPAIALDRVAAIMDADTRAQVSVLLGALAGGLRGRGGDVQAAAAQLRVAVDPARQVVSALARRRVLLTRLVEATARVGRVAGDRAGALAAALRDGRRTLAVTAGRERDLSRTVGGLPGTLDTLNTALTETQALGRTLDPALTRLRPAARAVPRALAAFETAAPAARSLLAELDGLVTADGATIRAAARLTKELAPAARDLTDPLRKAAPVVAAVDARRDGIALLGETFSGVLSTNDANGPVVRGLGTFEPFDPANVGEPGASPARSARLATLAARALTRTCLKGATVACLVRYLVPGLPGAVRK